MAHYELYRKSTIGSCLLQAVDELVMSGQISPDLAVKIALQFDKSMNEALQTKIKSKTVFRGHLHTYRFCDNVWTFILEDGLFKTDNEQINVERVKIVACDAKILAR
eukprot:TRINITY_DN11466_c1_g1_i2.p2 TRINITY_DN11466_c1_g1~~TRINITY_DN11466_c1_g1_i2.p2  ORF type:complete len:107 (+),score=18.54 TRINITY_DN11466_c1_g1_i2:365-685(+)